MRWRWGVQAVRQKHGKPCNSIDVGVVRKDFHALVPIATEGWCHPLAPPTYPSALLSLHTTLYSTLLPPLLLLLAAISRSAPRYPAAIHPLLVPLLMFPGIRSNDARSQMRALWAGECRPQISYHLERVFCYQTWLYNGCNILTAHWSLYWCNWMIYMPAECLRTE